MESICKRFPNTVLLLSSACTSDGIQNAKVMQCSPFIGLDVFFKNSFAHPMPKLRIKDLSTLPTTRKNCVRKHTSNYVKMSMHIPTIQKQNRFVLDNRLYFLRLSLAALDSTMHISKMLWPLCEYITNQISLLLSLATLNDLKYKTLFFLDSIQTIGLISLPGFSSRN